VAPNGHAAVVAECPLLMDERTKLRRGPRSEFDPNATSTRRGPSHPAYDGYFDSAPPPIPAGSGCVISSRIGMGISVAGPRRGER
jgi:hypothetical protein